MIDIDSFTIGYKFDLAKFWDYDNREQDLICLSQMFSRSEVSITSTLVMRFQECYKTIINCIYNLDTFRGDDAKLFESCSQSSKTTITIYSLTAAESNVVVIGSDDDDVLREGGSECVPGDTFIPILPAGDLTSSSLIINTLYYIGEAAKKRGTASGTKQII